jgi:hypothetical protein
MAAMTQLLPTACFHWIPLHSLLFVFSIINRCLMLVSLHPPSCIGCACY